MRSACLGAISVRNLMTMRPLVVSMTIAFCLSRLAGSGWASAGATQTSAARTARIRIMRTSGRLKDDSLVWRLLVRGWLVRGLGLIAKPVAVVTDANARSGEFVFQAAGDRRRHERGDVAAHRRDLAYQCGGDRANRNRGRNEDGVHLRRHGLVHAGDLHFIIEVGAVAQAANHDGGADLLR